MFKKARYVYAVYKSGSFTKAAEELYISQPCLSAAIKKLEEELGTSLFYRGTVPVLPTELGLEYIRAAEKIISIEDAFAERLKRSGELLSGTVRLGGSNYISSYVLPRLVERFSASYPGVNIELVEASSSELSNMLAGGEIDLAVDSYDSESPLLSYIPLRPERILIAVPKSFSSNDGLSEYAHSPADLYNPDINSGMKKSVSIKAFSDETFILLKSGNSMYNHAMNAFKVGGFIPKVSLFLDQLSTSYFLSAEGSGISFVTDTVFRHHRFDDNVVLYFVKETDARTLGILMKKNVPPTSATAKFTELIKAELGQ